MTRDDVGTWDYCEGTHGVLMDDVSLYFKVQTFQRLSCARRAGGAGLVLEAGSPANGLVNGVHRGLPSERCPAALHQPGQRQAA